MSQPLYSPEPWEARYDEDAGAFSIAMDSAVMSPAQYSPAHMAELYSGIYPDYIRFEEVRANVHLMAAAPALLAACQAAQAYVAHVLSTSGGTDGLALGLASVLRHAVDQALPECEEPLR